MESTSTGSDTMRDELRGDARTVSDSAKKFIHGEVDSRKDDAAGQAKSLSSALGRASQELGDDSPSWVRSALSRASQTVEELADAVERKDSRQLTEDAQRIARQNPGSFLAACAFAGFAAARVMQAGNGSNSAHRGASGELGGRTAAGMGVQPDPYARQSVAPGAVV